MGLADPVQYRFWRFTVFKGLRSTAYVLTACAAALMTVLVPSASVAKPQAANAQHKCVSVRPAIEFYEAGRVGSFPQTVPESTCTTISVSHIKDPNVPSDHCQTFLVGFFPIDGSEPTYTEPVAVCSTPPSTRTVLASNVPDGTVYRILYNVDYIDPTIQIIRYKIWH
jgi:hypothetical protein